MTVVVPNSLLERTDPTGPAGRSTVNRTGDAIRSGVVATNVVVSREDHQLIHGFSVAGGIHLWFYGR
jgi:hypothetical protein